MSSKEYIDSFLRVRSTSQEICKSLTAEDMVIQSDQDISPPKWHLGHTTWFFEVFILQQHVKGYKPFHEKYNFIFNSYYESFGERIPRFTRKLLNRPTLEQVMEYRKTTDEKIIELLQNCSDEEIFNKVEIGLHHEQQHQELLYTDIKHIFFRNPLKPAYRKKNEKMVYSNRNKDAKYVEFEGGLVEIGHEGNFFAFDSEKPRHKYYLEPFQLASKCVTNSEFLNFILDGGYKKSLYWLSDGWDIATSNKWTSPLYWQEMDREWYEFTLHGFEKLHPEKPICHISFYEANAFACWNDKRLPTEFEWEYASSHIESMHTKENNFVEKMILHPVPEESEIEFRHLLGNIWEWTSSSYLPYPGFKPLKGAMGEYNGKFMNDQRVLRGGSCVTPNSHIRNTYRNFLQSSKRWQFSGFRLANI